MPTSADDSILFLDTIRFPYGSNLAITEEASLPSGAVKMNANGTKGLDFSIPELNLYSLSYNSSDAMCLPAETDIAQGSIVNVSCINERVVRVPAGQTTVNLPRPPIDGSIRAEKGDGVAVDVGATIDGQTVTIAAQESNIYLYWRMQLRCYVSEFRWSLDEYGARVGWTLGLQEIRVVP